MKNNLKLGKSIHRSTYGFIVNSLWSSFRKTLTEKLVGLVKVSINNSLYSAYRSCAIIASNRIDLISEAKELVDNEE